MFLFPLTNPIKILLVVMLIWTNVIFFWKGCGNMMLTLHTKEDRTYTCFIWKGKRVARRPISPTTRSTRENASSLVSLCSPFDRNSKISSFEEERSDVGRQSNKVRLKSGLNRSLGRPPGRPRYSAEDLDRPPDRHHGKEQRRIPVDG